MGRDYSAMVFIGYKIKKDKLITHETIKRIIKTMCQCKENKESNNFCPKCGNQNIKRITETKEIKYLSDYKQFNPYEAYGKQFEHTYIILKNINGASDSDQEPVISKLKELTITQETKDKFMEEVKKVEPWNENNYGLYTFVDCSY